jgi:hypothetical protein
MAKSSKPAMDPDQGSLRGGRWERKRNSERETELGVRVTVREKEGLGLRSS